jgi:type IV pilus assembly protein PilC
MEAMARFHYTAIDQTGNERGGVLEAPTAEQAAAQVKQSGLFPTCVAAEAAADTELPAGARRHHPLVLGRPVGARVLGEFTRQLGTLVQAGLPLLRSLQVLGRQERQPALRRIIEELGEAIAAGESFSAALGRHPRVFPKLYVGMVRAGEAGGRLEVVLLQLARFMEKAERIRRRILAAMCYPAAVMTVTVLIVAALMLFVVPKFRVIFAEQLHGAPLPGLTQAVMEASSFIGGNVLWIVLVLGGACALQAALRATARGQQWVGALLLATPLVGELVRRTAVARFARTLGTLMANGVPILQALEIARDTCGNAVLAAALTAVHGRVQGGSAVAAALAATQCFPDMLVSMVSVGEETGALAEMLVRVADAYDDEVDTAVGGLTSLLEPLMIVFLALTVGTIVIALFLPIVRIIQTMS